MGTLVERFTSASPSASYMSISTHIISRSSNTWQIWRAARGLKLKFRSKAICTSGPAPCLNAEMYSRTCRSSAGVTFWSVLPGAPPKPGP